MGIFLVVEPYYLGLTLRLGMGAHIYLGFISGFHPSFSGMVCMSTMMCMRRLSIRLSEVLIRIRCACIHRDECACVLEVYAFALCF